MIEMVGFCAFRLESMSTMPGIVRILVCTVSDRLASLVRSGPSIEKRICFESPPTPSSAPMWVTVMPAIRVSWVRSGMLICTVLRLRSARGLRRMKAVA